RIVELYSSRGQARDAICATENQNLPGGKHDHRSRITSPTEGPRSRKSTGYGIINLCRCRETDDQNPAVIKKDGSVCGAWLMEASGSGKSTGRRIIKLGGR